MMKLFKKATTLKSEKSENKLEKKSISTYIFSKSWKKVAEVVASDKSKAYSCDAHCCVTCGANHAPLQFVCCCKPTLSIVETMTVAYPEALRETDCMGRHPLHVACEYAAKPQVIRYLIERYPSALKIPDKNGRLPLHSLLEGYWGRSDPKLSEEECNDNLLDTVELLLEHFPCAVLAKDVVGRCPIEYALASDHDRMILNILQKSSVDERRRISQVYQTYALQRSYEKMKHMIAGDGLPVVISLAGYGQKNVFDRR